MGREDMSWPSLKLSVSTDYDLTFFEAGEAFTLDCLGFRLELGIRDGTRVAGDGVATFDLSGSAYRPETAAAADIRPGYFVQLTANWATDEPLWTGLVDRVEWINAQVMRLHCRTRWSFSDVEVRLPYLTDVRGDEVIDEALYQAMLPQGRYEGGDKICVIGTDVIGSCRPFDGSPWISLDTGADSWEYFGDYREIGTLRQIVTELTLAEWGYWLERQDGYLLWKNRASLYNAVAAVTLTDSDLLDVGYRYGVDATALRLRTMSREVVLNAVVWTAHTDLRFPVGEYERVFRVDFDGDLPVGADDLTADFTWLRDGVAVTDVLFELYPQGAALRLVVRNPAGVVYLQAGSVVRGTAIKHRIIDYDKQNGLARAEAGARQQVMILPLAGDDEITMLLASWYLNTASQVMGQCWMVRLAPSLSHMVDYPVGSFIRVNSAHLGHDETYLLVGIEAEGSGSNLALWWVLAPVSGVDLFVVGTDAIGSDAVLAL